MSDQPQCLPRDTTLSNTCRVVDLHMPGHQPGMAEAGFAIQCVGDHLLMQTLTNHQEVLHLGQEDQQHFLKEMATSREEECLSWEMFTHLNTETLNAL